MRPATTQQDLELHGAVALVTGATGGIGRAITSRLATEGTDLVLAARDGRALEEVAAEVRARGVRAWPCPTDLTEPDAPTELGERAVAMAGRVDVLVHAAGFEALDHFTDTRPDTIHRALDLNLRAPLLLTRVLLPGMLRLGRGHVVSISSIAGKAGASFHVAYSASKFGLVGMTHALHSEYVHTPIGFSVVCPGPVRDAGMFARHPRVPGRAHWTIGTTTPDRVARAVVRAVRRRRLDTIVSPGPIRLVIAAGELMPPLRGWVERGSGVRSMFGRILELRDSATEPRDTGLDAVRATR